MFYDLEGEQRPRASIVVADPRLESADAGLAGDVIPFRVCRLAATVLIDHVTQHQ